MKLTIINRNDDLYPTDKYMANEERGASSDEYPCPICGKAAKYVTKNGSFLTRALHMFSGGSLLTDVEDFEKEGLTTGDFNPNGDMNFFPLGRTCWNVWKKIKASGLYDVDMSLQSDTEFKVGQRVLIQDDNVYGRSYVITAINGNQASLIALTPQTTELHHVVEGTIPLNLLINEISFKD